MKNWDRIKWILFAAFAYAFARWFFHMLPLWLQML